MDANQPQTPDPRLLTQQMLVLAQNLPRMTFGNILLATGTSGILVVTGAPRARVLAWLLVNATYQLLRLVLFLGLRRHPINPENAKRWAQGATISAALSGLIWGGLEVLVFDAGDPVSLAVLAIVLSAMMASATNSLGAYWPANVAFSLPCNLPFTVECLITPMLHIQILGGLSLLYLGFTASYAKGIAGTILESLLLRFENEALLEDLREAKEKAEAANIGKTRLMAAASHDLRQPIHAMNLSLPVLRKLDLGAPDTIRTIHQVSDRLQLALDTMSKLLHSLLDVSRLDAGYLKPQLRPCSVEAVLNTVVDQVRALAEAKGIHVRVADRGDWVMCDDVMLHSMVSNLVHNAVRYTDRGRVLVGTRRRSGRVLIEVWDTGCGIPAEDLPRLCEEFFQASNAHRPHSATRGFGLGLAIVHRMAGLTGGELTIRSQLGRGSRFSIALPACEPTPAPPTPTPDERARVRQRTVLIVDNDANILAAIRELLNSWGHRVLTAQSLEEARSQAMNRADEIDLALIDFHLSDQTSGLDAVLALRGEVRQDLPLVILTGDTSHDTTSQAQEVGVCVLYKPVNPVTLQGIIEAVDVSLPPCR